jgi:glycosyltransferase involved in cell wall biosynthesis
MSRILFVSYTWPDEKDPLKGIFIKEHALAISQNHAITVLVVNSFYRKGILFPKIKQQATTEGKLSVNRIECQVPRFYKKFFLGAIVSFALQLICHYLFSKKILSTKKIDLIHLNTIVPFYLCYLYFPIYKNYPMLLTEHSGAFIMSGKGELNFQMKQLKWLMSKLINHPRIKAVTAVSDLLRKTLQTDFTITKTIHVVHNVVDMGGVPTDSKERNLPIRICLAAIWQAPKNLVAFVELLHRLDWNVLPQVDIHIYGRGPQYDIAKANCSLNFVHFGSVLTKEELFQELKKAHLLIHPTNSETFSCIVAEALCSGTPVLSNKTGIMLEVINESNGIAVDVGDEQAFERAFIKILHQIKDDYFQSSSISDTARKKFNAAEISKQFTAVYQEIIQH